MYCHNLKISNGIKNDRKEEEYQKRPHDTKLDIASHKETWIILSIYFANLHKIYSETNVMKDDYLEY